MRPTAILFLGFGPTVAVPAVAQMTSPSATLYLACRGSGERTVVNRGGSATGSAGRIGHTRVGDSGALSIDETTSKSEFDDQMEVSILGNSGKVRLPRRFLPFLNNAQDGWIRIDHLQVGRREIAGDINVDIVDHPQIRIDRVAGSVTMDGKIGSFYGQCQPLDPDHPAF